MVGMTSDSCTKNPCPCRLSYPKEIPAGSTSDAMMVNVDFPAIFMELSPSGLIKLPLVSAGCGFAAVGAGTGDDDGNAVELITCG